MTTIELKQTLQDVLRLDSVYGLLDYAERINVRGYMLDWYWAALSPGVINLVAFLSENEVVIPALKIGQDRLVYVQNEHSWELLSIDDYRAENEQIANYLKSIYNNE